MTPPLATRTILLIDDNPDDRARIHRMLRTQRRRYTIVECGTGAEALAFLRAGTTPVDCVLLDQYLPDMDGDDVLGALRGPSGRVPLPVSMLTGHDEDALASRVLDLGAEDYLLKDEVTPHALARSVENAIERFGIRQQLEAQRAMVELRNARLEAMQHELEARLVELGEATHARDRFMAMMSHEMRTPLNAVLGYAELLELQIDGQLNDTQRRSLERIRVGSQHLLALINDVLDLARADARRLELDVRPVDVVAAVEEVAALLEQQAAQKGLAIVTRVDAGMPLANADLQRLRQILTNLLGNAIKFTDEGEITIGARPLDDGRAIAVEVRDTGIGIDPQTFEHLFREFYQADNALTRIHGGSGLGLAISQRLAHAMGGDIAVSSVVGVGSTFVLTLPAAGHGSEARPEDTAQHAARMSRHHDAADDGEGAELPAPPDATPVVAFADDTDALRALERQVDHAVRLAWTTAPADVPALVRRERATLVILDSSAAGGAAWQVAHAVSDLESPIAPAILLLPRLATTDAAPARSTPGSLNLGWVALVPKPFTSEQLTRAVSTAAGRARGDAEDGAELPGIYEVMVLDDDEDSRRVAGRFLRERGVRVREVPDGETGLVEMRLRPPDVVVLDLMMPVLDGFGVLATMRADPLLATIPVVVLTSKSLTDAERQFLARTAVRVLQKGEHRLGDIAALVLRAAASARRSDAEAPIE